HARAERPEGAAVKPLRVTLVDPVLRAEAPVALADCAPVADGRVRREQLGRDVRLDRRRRLVADVQPDHPDPLLDRVGADVALADDRRLRAVCDRGDELAALQVEGPAVIAAGPRAGELL